MKRDVESSPQVYARIGGALYFALIALGVVSETVRDRLVTSGNASETAASIVASESLWRIGIASECIALVCVTSLAMIYFVLLRPVSRELNLLATFLRLVGISVEAVATLNLFSALFPLTNDATLKAFTPDQVHAMAYLAIKAHAHGFALALFFFGFTFLTHGYLIFRSGYLPRTLGVLIQIAGGCYLTNSLAVFLAPALSARLFPAILIPCFIAEASLCVWLLVKGVNVEKWRLATQRHA